MVPLTFRKWLILKVSFWRGIYLLKIAEVTCYCLFKYWRTEKVKPHCFPLNCPFSFIPSGARHGDQNASVSWLYHQIDGVFVFLVMYCHGWVNWVHNCHLVVMGTLKCDVRWKLIWLMSVYMYGHIYDIICMFNMLLVQLWS